MTVYVVVSDVGLAGARVHAACSKRPDDTEVRDWVRRSTISSDTGYQHTWVEEVELDGEWK